MPNANPIYHPNQITPSRPCDAQPRAARGTGRVSRRKRQRLAAMLADEAAKWPAIRRITINGLPIGKPRQTRRDRWAKRPCVMRYREWADAARDAAGTLPPAEVVTMLRVTAYFPIPESRTDVVAGERYCQKPDGDNILKAVCDALWPKRDEGLGQLVVDRYWTNGLPCMDVLIIVEGGNRTHALALPATQDASERESRPESLPARTDAN